MSEELGLRAEFSADVAGYLSALDRAIDANQRFGKSVGLTGKEIDQQDKKLNQVRGAVTGATGETSKAEKAQRGFSQALKESEGSLARTRYALYDVATTYAAVSAATLGAASAGAIFATKYESAFTEIERTTLSSSGQISSGMGKLREDFLDLSEVLPLSFEELTKIGSLGAQLGIAEQDLTSFTDTVAKFARLSGVSAEQSALAFGRIGELLNVPATQYANLGSAIAATAVSSAATEAQIISLTKELSAGATGAGLTADAVVGLSSTLASLGVAPERARGALSMYYGTLNKAVAEGGQKLENFAIITGTTTEQLEKLVRAGKGGEVLERFITGLSQLDNVAKTTALDELGLSQLRVEDTFRRLSQNLDFYNEQLGISSQAIGRGTFLNDAFAVVLDDVASQFQLVKNSVGRFLATAGKPMLEFLRVALPVLAGFLGNLSDFVDTPFGQNVATWVTAGLAFVGVLTGIRAAIALATASTYALITAQSLATGSGILGALRALTGGFATLTGATITWRNALLGIVRATGVLLLLGLAMDVLITKGEGLRSVFGQEVGGAIYDTIFAVNGLAIGIDVLTTGGAGLARVMAQGIDVFGGLLDIISSLSAMTSNLAGGFVNAANGAADAFPAFGGLRDIISGIAGAARDAYYAVSNLTNTSNRGAIKEIASGIRIGGSRPKRQAMFRTEDSGLGVRNLGSAADWASDMFDNLGDIGGGAMDDIGGGAADAAKEIRTLVDYASDLSGVFSRAFDLRFGSQLAVDEIANQWDTLGDRIRQARMEIQGLTADKNIKEYFLSVADAYGDELRSGKLRAEIADINQEIADTQADASTELNGNSKAARGNRKTLTDLAKGYENYIVQLAESGADQASLNAAVTKSEREFRAQALALGFSNQQLQPYIQSFRGLTTIINGVPRNITVSANINPALQALNEFAAKAYQAGRNGAAGFGKGFAAGGGVGVGAPNAAGFYQSGLNAGKSFRDGFVTYINREGGISFFDPKTGTKSPNSLKAYSGGGYTGRGGKYEPAGIVHKGEYVVPKSQVNQSTGLPYSDAMGGLKSGSRPTGSYAGGGLVGGGSMMVSLSPQDRALLRSMGASGDIVVAVNDREIARASASGSKKITQEGGRL